MRQTRGICSIQKWISPGGVFLTHDSRNPSVRCQSSPFPRLWCLTGFLTTIRGEKITHNHHHTCLPYWLPGNFLLSVPFCHIAELGVAFPNFNYRHSVWQLHWTLSCPLISDIDPTCLGKIVKAATCGLPSVCLAGSRCVMYTDSLGLWLWCCELWGDIGSHRVFIPLASHGG